MLRGRLQLEQIHHVDEADLHLRQLAVEDGYGGQRLQCRGLSGAGEDDVRLLSLVVAGPVPDADALGTVLHCLRHGQPLGAGMLRGHDHVHIVPGADAVVEGGQQAVGVRRQIQPDHVRLLVGNMIHEARILMGEAVMILLPDGGSHDQVQGRQLLPPGQLVADLQPLGMLRRHGIDDPGEGFIGGEESVPAGQQITLQPALAHMLGQHGVHHAAVGRQMVVRLIALRVPVPVLHLKHGVQPVGVGFVRPEDPEVAGIPVQAEDIPDKLAQLDHVLSFPLAVALGVEGVIPEVRQPQVPQQQSAVGMGIGADTAVPLRGQGPDFRQDPAVLIKELLRMVGPQPLIQNLQMFLRLRHGNRHLMGQKVALDPLSVHFLRAGPALGCPQHDHGPDGSGGIILFPGMLLDVPNPFDHGVHGFRHLPVHRHGIVPFHKEGLPAAAVEEIHDLLMAHAGEHRRIGNLISVQMKDGQHLRRPPPLPRRSGPGCRTPRRRHGQCHSPARRLR